MIQQYEKNRERLWKSIWGLTLFLIFTGSLTTGANAQNGINLLYTDARIQKLDLEKSNSELLDRRVTLNFDQVSIEKLLAYLEKGKNIQFSYNKELLADNPRVTVNLEEVSLAKALDEIFKNFAIQYYAFDGGYIVLREIDFEEADQIETVSGTVTDAESGETLPGVNIVVKNTTTGTSTDADGNYDLTVPSLNDTLIFSFIGYQTQEVPINGRTVVDIAMELQAVAGEELVVVGYGTMRSSDLTGSIGRVDLSVLEESPNVNILQSLQGIVPGLSVGAVNSSGENPSLNIRGQNNFSGENSPIIVLDGIIYRGNLNDINPTDVESVEILKDASAASVYGSEAANGVILVSTKTGGEEGKPIISYSATSSLQQPSNVVKPASAQENIRSIADSRWQASRLGPDYIERNPDFDVRTYFKTSDYVDGYNRFLEDGTETDWMNLLTGNAYIQDHNLSARGQSNNINYYFSGGFTNQNGYIQNDNYKRHTVRLNLSSDITDWLVVGINSFVTRSDYSGENVTQNELFEYHPLLSPYDEDGELILRPDGNRINPFHVSQIDDLNHENTLFANLYADVKLPFLKGFNYRVNFGNDFKRNQHYQFDPWASDGLGQGYKNNHNFYNLTLDNIFTYKSFFREDHRTDITLVFGVEKREGEMTNVSSGDFDNKILGYNGLELGNSSQYSINTDAWEETSLYTMGRVAYTFKERYMFTGTIRRDGFSGFGDDNKFGVFPSVAFGWNMSEEEFMENSAPWLSRLKWRVSYGTTARRSLSRYQTLARVNFGNSYVFGDGGSPVIGQWLTSMSNPELKWETTTGINIGVDYSLFNSRINGTIEYYNADTKDILYNVSLPQMTGFSSVSTNIGRINNYGLEFILDGEIIRKADFYWDATISYSMNRNQIQSIIGADFDGDGVEDDLVSDNLFIGKPLGVIYGYVNEGMWQLKDEEAGIIPDGFRPGTYKVKDLNGDGMITPDDRTILGYTEPAYRLSFASSASYQNFTIKALIYAIQGGKNYYYSTANDPGGGSGDNWDNRGKPKLWDYWLPENPDAKYRRLDETSSHHQPLLAQRNFIRLQNVSLSYQFGSNFLDKLNIRRLQVYISGKNLATWAPQWDGWDPETGEGYSSSGTPVLKNYSIGLNLEF